MPIEYIGLLDPAEMNPDAVGKFSRLLVDGHLEALIESREQLGVGRSELDTSSSYAHVIEVFPGGEEAEYVRALPEQVRGNLSEESWDKYRETRVRIPQDNRMIALTAPSNNGTISVLGLIAHRAA